MTNPNIKAHRVHKKLVGCLSFIHYPIKQLFEKDLLFQDFYVATFDNLSSEVVWGAGYSIKDALEDAKRNWDREGDEYPNPFREALENLNEEGNNVLQNY